MKIRSMRLGFVVFALFTTAMQCYAQHDIECSLGMDSLECLACSVRNNCASLCPVHIEDLEAKLSTYLARAEALNLDKYRALSASALKCEAPPNVLANAKRELEEADVIVQSENIDNYLRCGEEEIAAIMRKISGREIIDPQSIGNLEYQRTTYLHIKANRIANVLVKGDNIKERITSIHTNIANMLQAIKGALKDC